MAADSIVGSAVGDRLIRRDTATWTIRVGLVVEAALHLVLATSMNGYQPRSAEYRASRSPPSPMTRRAQDQSQQPQNRRANDPLLELAHQPVLFGIIDAIGRYCSRISGPAR